MGAQYPARLMRQWEPPAGLSMRQTAECCRLRTRRKAEIVVNPSKRWLSNLDHNHHILLSFPVSLAPSSPERLPTGTGPGHRLVRRLCRPKCHRRVLAHGGYAGTQRGDGASGTGD